MNIYVLTVINLSSLLSFLIIHQRGTSKSRGNKKETHTSPGGHSLGTTHYTQKGRGFNSHW